MSDGGEDQGAKEELFMGCMPREDRFRQFRKPSPGTHGSPFSARVLVVLVGLTLSSLSRLPAGVNESMLKTSVFTVNTPLGPRPGATAREWLNGLTGAFHI